jgi:protein SCO1
LDLYLQRRPETDVMAAHMQFTPFHRGILKSGILIISILCFCLCGCSRPAAQRTELKAPGTGTEAAGGSRKGSGPTTELKEFTLVGEVKKVDKETREITIRHEKIAGFMEAMTMPFRTQDPAVLDEVRPGDQVEGKLQVEQENGQTKDYRLVDLRVVKPALAVPLVLDLSGPAARLRTRPKVLQPGDSVPDFAMTKQDGKAFKLSDLRGYVVVLTFIYTRCPLPDFCPAMDRKFSDLALSIGAFPGRAEKIRLLSVSFDPDHDTPEILRKHATIRGAMPPLWAFAVATHDELAKITGPLGLVYGPGKDEIIHNLCTAVIDQNGRLVRLEVGTQRNKWSSADLLKTVYSLIPAFQK